jgi:hypothetical protein
MQYLWVVITAAELFCVGATDFSFAQTSCRLTDPTGTPLNVRTTPNGHVVGTLNNGIEVSVLDHASDRSGKAGFTLLELMMTTSQSAGSTGSLSTAQSQTEMMSQSTSHYSLPTRRPASAASTTVRTSRAIRSRRSRASIFSVT